MNLKFLKIWLITAYSFCGLGAIYYLIRLGDLIFNENETPKLLLSLNLYAIISFGIAIIMFILVIPMSKKVESKVNNNKDSKQIESEILNKYKSKK